MDDKLLSMVLILQIMMKQKFFSAYIVLCFVSCVSNKEDHVVDVFNEYKKQINFNDLIEDFQIIPLETVEESLIGKIDKIEVFGDYVFILDKQISKKLFIFSRNGGFIKKIGQIGKGPMEILEINDFTINTFSNQLVILCNMNKLLFYDIEQEKIVSDKLLKNTLFTHIAYNSKNYYLYNSRLKGKYSIYIYDNNLTLKGTMMKYLNTVDFGHLLPNPIISNQEELFFIDIYNATLFKGTDMVLGNKVDLNFSGEYMPENVLSNYNMFMQENEKYMYINQFIVANDLIWISLSNKDHLSLIIYDINKMKCKFIDKIDLPFDLPYPRPLHYKDEKFWGILDANFIIEATSSSYYDEIRASLVADDNPVIYTFRLKKEYNK